MSKGILRVQNAAGDAFPAQELWHNPETMEFWAFEKNENEVSCTSGTYTESGIQSYTTRSYETEEPDAFVERLLSRKEEDGFVCFGIML